MLGAKERDIILISTILTKKLKTMKEQAEEERIIILSTGYNGSTLYSMFTDKEKTRVPILTKKELKEFSKEIIRMYPDISEEIHKIFESAFSRDYPKKFDFSHLGPEPTANLVEEISIEWRKKQKTV